MTYAAHLTANLLLSSPWAIGSNLYVMWIDDNAVQGSYGYATPTEGPNAIDNFALDLGECVTPVIDTQPHSVTADNCTPTNLTVVVTGSASTLPPPTLQWLKDGSVIAGATNATYNIPNATTADNGTYYVEATACGMTVQSTTVTVTVTTNAAIVVRALVQSDLKTIVVTFSQRMDPGTLQPTSYTMVPTDGGAQRVGQNAMLSSSNTVLTLTLDGPITAEKNYELQIQPNGLNCAGNPLGPIGNDGLVHVGYSLESRQGLQYQLSLISMTNTAWRIATNGINLGVSWRSDPNYDDGDTNIWATGVGAFDSKSGTDPGRTTVGGVTVNTFLPLRYPTSQNAIPVYYFRTHFTVPTAPSEVVSLQLTTLSDDFDAAWLNLRDTPFHTRSGFPETTSVDDFTYTYTLVQMVTDAAKEGPFEVNASLLNYGNNVICAKEFQHNQADGDITFAYDLVAVVKRFHAPAALSIVLEGNNVHIRWTDAAMHLYQSDTIEAPPEAWTSVSNQAVGEAILINDGARFFTLRQ